MISIDLKSPNGNGFALIGFALIGFAMRIGKELGMPKTDISAITTKMMAGDYNNLLNVLVESFPGIHFEFDNDPRNNSMEME